MTGHLDKGALVDQIKELVTPEDNPEKRRERLVSNPAAMSDEEFVEASSQTLDEIKTGQIARPGELLSLFGAFEAFGQNKLISATADSMLQVFREGLDKSVKESRFQYNPMFEAILNHPLAEPQTDARKDFTRQLQEANREAHQREDRKRISKAVSTMKVNQGAFIDSLSSSQDGGLLHTSVFNAIDPTEVADWIVNLPNPQKMRLRFALQMRYEQGIADTFADELANLADVRDRLNKHLEGLPRGVAVPMSQVLIQQLAKMLDSILKGPSP